MTRAVGVIRGLLLIEGASFVVAGLAHSGVLAWGSRDIGAAIPESIIGMVLLAGVVASRLVPSSTRAVAIATQSFALLGTLVGIWVTAIGIGPSTPLDIAFHVAILVTLIAGLFVALRAGREDEPARLTLLALVQVVRRASLLLQLALGLALWAGFLRPAVPFHIANGVLFVALVELQAVTAALNGVPLRLPALAGAWGIVVVVLGLSQTAILQGDLHWIVQLSHLAVGIAAGALTERVERAARSQLLHRVHDQSPSPMRVLEMGQP